MFGWKSTYQQQRVEGVYYIDGPVVTIEHLLFLGETFKGRKEAAYEMKVAMERFAKEFGYQKKLDYIYEMRPYIKNLRLEDA